jgi:hypothetical protein
MSDQILSIAISSCLGLSNAVGIGLGGPGGGVKKVECVRFRMGGDGYESPLEDNDEGNGDLHSAGPIKETFDVTFALSFGLLSGEWIAKGLQATTEEARSESPSHVAQDHDRVEPGQSATAAWKTKFQDAQRKLWESQEEVKALKEKILEAVL